MKKINVLSLFDGMSCGQIALERAGFIVGKYFAAEIDKYAIKVTQANYPQTIQLGDVRQVKAKDLPKIDLLIGGSPCQGFSFAGKQLNFNDERSKLFFEYVRIKKELEKVNPNLLFLLENVNMKRSYLRIISEYLGVFPVRINSNLVSAQNRDRWYWSNIKTKDVGLFSELWTDIPQPKDKGLQLKDVLQYNSEMLNKFYIESENRIKFVKDEWRINKKYTQLNGEKSLPLLARMYKTWSGDYIKTEKGIRQLTPIECERLQTVPDNYTNHVSDTQRYKMLGNGWTVDVISHIFKYIQL